jgi:hypothetical protein
LKGSIGKGIFYHHQVLFICKVIVIQIGQDVLLLEDPLLAIAFFLVLISFLGKTKKQATVSRPSAEAEYRAMATLTFELQWLKYLLCDVGISHSSPITMFCDNQATLHIANNPVFHERTKYIEIGCHFIRKKLQSKLIAPRYILASNRIIKKASSVEISLTSAGLWWCFTKGSALLVSLHT